MRKLSSFNRLFSRYWLGIDEREGDVHDSRYFTFSAPSIAIIDEPEAGLHPLAENHLAEGIGSLADHILVASHSTRFLNVGLMRGGSQLVERVSDGRIRVSSSFPPMSTKNVERLQEKLGLDPAALVSLTSAYVLVEGLHDQAVIESFLEPDLRQLRTEIIPMQGTKGLPDFITSPFIFVGTSAPIVVVLDNGSQSVVDSLMNQLNSTTSRIEREVLLRRALKDFKTTEMKAIHSLIRKAVETDRLSRVHPFVLRRRDVVEYIPISCFSAEFESWEEASRRFLIDFGRQTYSPGDGIEKKAWLRENGVDVTERGIRRALKQMIAEGHPTPNDFEKLADLIRGLTRARM